LLNDFEAIACSLAELQPSDLEVIGLPSAPDLAGASFTVGVVGPGTGLGAAALLKRGDRFYPLVTEGGHVGFAPENGLQRAVWEVLGDRFGRVSDERLVSGSGLENIYTALSEIHDISTPVLAAAEIFAHTDDNSLAREAVNLFFEVMGQVAGNFALSTGAFDGIFIAGGIAKRYPELLAGSAFRSGFENKGRHRHIMEKVPTLLITHQQPGLLGASVAARGLV
jgi:glucokinase